MSALITDRRRVKFVGAIPARPLSHSLQYRAFSLASQVESRWAVDYYSTSPVAIAVVTAIVVATVAAIGVEAGAAAADAAALAAIPDAEPRAETAEAGRGKVEIVAAGKTQAEMHLRAVRAGDSRQPAAGAAAVRTSDMRAEVWTSESTFAFVPDVRVKRPEASFAPVRPGYWSRRPTGWHYVAPSADHPDLLPHLLRRRFVGDGLRTQVATRAAG